MTPVSTVTAMPSKTYEFLKLLVQIYLPAFGTLYMTLAAVWGLPFAQQVAASCLAVGTFLGVCLKISTKNYYNNDANFDGDMIIQDNGTGFPDVNAAFQEHPDLWRDKPVVTLRVKNAADRQPGKAIKGI